jgi:hypothetical protein
LGTEVISPKAKILAQDSGYWAIDDVIAPFPIWTGDGIKALFTMEYRGSEAISVNLLNGIELTCSPEQKFVVRVGTKEGTEEARNLTSSHLVKLTDNTFDFDYLDLEHNYFLNYLNSYEFGLLCGIVKCTRAGQTLDFPRNRREVNRTIKLLLEKCDIVFTKQEYYKRTDRVKYIIDDDAFWMQIGFWSDFSDSHYSKLFCRGYLKALFTFGQIGTEMFSVRAEKDSEFLKNVQQALLLFGINSNYINGLRVSHLIVSKNNCYRFSNKIGVFNLESLFEGVDYKRFLRYKDRTTLDMSYARVRDVKDKGIERLVELKASRVMANGVVLENYE